MIVTMKMTDFYVSLYLLNASVFGRQYFCVLLLELSKPIGDVSEAARIQGIMMQQSFFSSPKDVTKLSLAKLIIPQVTCI